MKPSEELHEFCEVNTDHYKDFLKRKQERQPWIIKEWEEGEGIMKVHHYIAKM